MKTETYTYQQTQLPQQGQYIIGQSTQEEIIVYQAFSPNIARYAVSHQRFGGAHYSFNRMTWIKPNFMWMMFRSGWAQKVNQERILAIRLSMKGFKEILRAATWSRFEPSVYRDSAHWQQQLQASLVRLQWDPDHDPIGNKLERKAIQLGLKGKMLQQMNEEWIRSIEDITDFVKMQQVHAKGNYENLKVPYERVISFEGESLIIQNIGLDE